MPNVQVERKNSGPIIVEGERKPRIGDPIVSAEGHNKKIDLERGEKDLPRIYDVDESMSLQRMARKA